MKEITNSKDIKKHLESQEIVYLYMAAEWCGPCRAFSPIVKELSLEFKDKVLFIKCDVDKVSDLAQEYGVRGIPTSIIFKNGLPQKTFVGLQTKEKLEEAISQLL